MLQVVEPDIAEPGDTMVVEIGRTSVLILRDDDMRVQAFHNVCRHRGATLVAPGKSSVGNVVCRYHAWTYGLDGRLLVAQQMGERFDASCHGLKRVHLKSIAGLLFICLADTPPADIDDLAAQMTPYIAPHQIANCRIAKEVDLIEAGNWKLTMENNRECYHCAVTHPELTVSLFEYGFGFAPDSLDDTRRAQIAHYDRLVGDLGAEWEAKGLPSALIEELVNRPTGFRTQRLPIDGAGESQTMDTRVACRRLLGDFTEKRLGGLTFWTQPNSWHHFMSDHIVTFMAMPLDPGHTLVRTKWLVHKDAVEGIDYDLANLTSVWDATNQQDATLVGLAQSGASSPAYEPGPYSPYTEGLVEQFCTWYCQRMTAEFVS